MVGSHSGHLEVSHSGATAGYRCWLAYYPQDDLSIVYLSNASYFSTTGTGTAVANIFFGPELKKAVSEPEDKVAYIANVQDLKQWVGTYYSRECDGTYSVKLEMDSLCIYDHARKKKALKPVAKDQFETDSSTQYRFESFGTDKQMFISVPRARNVKFENL